MLDKIHRLSGVLHGYSGDKQIDTDGLCALLSELIGADAYLLDQNGVLKAHFLMDKSSEIKEIGIDDGECINSEVNARLLGILSTKENIMPGMLGITQKNADTVYGCVVPVIAYGDRIGTLFLFNKSSQYDIDDTIICEIAADAIGIEMANLYLREETVSSGKKNEVQAALRALSHSEKEAVVAVFSELKGIEGVLVASRVSDRSGIGRSVIINSLRKLESAGVIESKSAGMKGTYIKVCNEYLYDEIVSLKNKI